MTENLTGRVAAVETLPLGSVLMQDAPAGAASLLVEDAADFSEDGGTLWLNDAALDYTTCDDETGEITLAAPSPSDAFTDDRVEVYDPTAAALVVETIAHVVVEGTEQGGDPLEAIVDHSLVPFIPEGIRDDATGEAGEAVTLAWRGDDLYVVDVIASPVVFDGAHLAVGSVKAEHISADAIDGRVITGSIIQTSASGQRMVFGGSAGGMNLIEGHSGASQELSPAEIQMFNLGLRIRANEIDGGPSRWGAAQLHMDYEGKGTDENGDTIYGGMTYLRGGGYLMLDSFWDTSNDPNTNPTPRCAISIDMPQIRTQGNVTFGSRAFEWTPITVEVGDGDGGHLVVEDDITVGDPHTTGAPKVKVAGSGITLTEEIWHMVGTSGEPAYENGWKTYLDNEGFRAGFRVLPDGDVIFRGTIQGGAAGAVAFTLPEDYWPVALMTLITMAAVSNTHREARVDVNTSGQVIPRLTTGTTSGDWIALPSLRFSRLT